VGSRTPSLGWSGYQTDRLWFSRITHSDVGFDEAEVSIDCCRLFFPKSLSIWRVLGTPRMYWGNDWYRC
jgi:hypothetical protein